MKLYQSDLEDIQKLTKKEYEVQYSNNAESEFVKIYDTDVVEQIIEDLLKVAQDYKWKAEHLQEEFEELQEDVETNFRRIPIGEQVGITDKDFL